MGTKLQVCLGKVCGVINLLLAHHDAWPYRQRWQLLRERGSNSQLEQVKLRSKLW